MTRSARFCLAAAVAAAASAFACGGTSPAAIAGDYTVDITDEANGCAFANFTQGQSASAIPVTISQDDSSLTVAVMGVAAVTLDAGLGAASFTGTVDGDSFNATLVGDKTFGSDGCVYTLNASIEGSVSGDTISGTIDYTSETTTGSACGSITNCETTQDYSGARPPS